ncbi:hypothetical protein J6590_056707 [Homalodisca vitripennis]|nr:hypothetical protein J6590_056707 [Homalodisca vitripennis]
MKNKKIVLLSLVRVVASLNRKSPVGGEQERDSSMSEAVPSLNRKSPVGGEQERDSSMSEAVARFCHECGAKYPVIAAKFCCQCGVRRLII